MARAVTVPERPADRRGRDPMRALNVLIRLLIAETGTHRHSGRLLATAEELFAAMMRD